MCAVCSLGLTCAAIAWKSGNAASAAALQNATLAGQRAAQDVELELSRAFEAVHTLAATLSASKERGLAVSREQLDAHLRAVLEAHPDWLAVYSAWEPNALDGRDAELAGRLATADANGRFLSYWHRTSGKVEWQLLTFLDAAGANDWYDLPHDSGRDNVTEPMRYPIGNEQVLVSSLVAPVLVSGRFMGMVGVDYRLEGLQQVLARVRTIPGARLSLLSTEGRYVAHPDGAKAGLPAADLDATALKAVADGQPHELRRNGWVRLLLPVHASEQALPWSVSIEFPDNIATASAHELLLWSGAVALVCALLTGGVMVVLVRRLTKPLRELADTMEGLAHGDSKLSVTLVVKGRDELGRMAEAFNGFMAKLRAAFDKVHAATLGVDVAASEIASGNLDLSNRTEQQTSQLQEIASAVERLSGGVRGNADAAGRAARLTADAAAAARQSDRLVHDAVTAMQALAASSQRISEITAVIDGLAFQTNILALNAAVESARAGEHGKGFAVVASEVRTLARRSADAAKDIRGLIESSVQHVERGSLLIGQTGVAVGALAGAMVEVNTQAAQISAASQAQASAIAQVGAAVSQLDGLTQQNAALVEEAAAAAAALRQQTERMTETLGDFV
jgi:methyl-accepting chemotaxis protein